MPRDDRPFRDRVTHKLPPHLAGWQLPSDWTWGADGVDGEYRHYQELVDGLGRSLSLVSVPNTAHEEWLFSEARRLAHLNHPSIPTTYHYWARHVNSPRGPGYLRRWIPGETVFAQVERAGTYDLATALQLLRNIGSAIAYLHTAGETHGAVSAETVLGGAHGTAVAARLGMGDAARRDPRRTRAVAPLHADPARVERRRMGAHDRERSVADRGHRVRDAHGRVSAGGSAAAPASFAPICRRA